MKITTSFLIEMEEKVNEMDTPPSPNPQKVSEAIFEDWEVNHALSYLNEGLERGGFQKRVFPRRIGRGPGKNSPGLGFIIDGEFGTDIAKLLNKGDESSESHPGKKGSMGMVEDLADGIMDDGRHLFEMWVIDYGHLFIEDMDVGREIFYQMVAQGYQDIFDDTQIEDWFYMG
ncbi:hypothetical protein [Salinibacter ruber]|uniref:hypothetical protein n=1 Tax=Salinibacter ruber TaxID=146919 RepID=UPI002074198B|nr:hypothetical protein [Salinibacter ruber]